MAKSAKAVDARHYDVIVAPHITEKSTLASEFNAIVFKVAGDATKSQIKEAVEAKSLSTSGGGPEAARTDITFFNLAGQLTGDPATLKAEDFWEFGPLERVKARLGQ